MLIFFISIEKIFSIPYYQSTSIATSIYDSQWPEKSITYKKGMVLIIKQSHRTLSLSAFKFADLSIELFTVVIEN